MGTVFASNLRAYRQWQRKAMRQQPQLGDAELEAAIMRIGAMFPGTVTRASA